MNVNEQIGELKGMRRTCEFCSGMHWYENGIISPLPDWEHDIAAAWGLVEEMGADSHAIPHVYRYDADNLWRVAFRVAGNMGFDFYEADTAPAAICAAWLKWKGAK